MIRGRKAVIKKFLYYLKKLIFISIWLFINLMVLWNVIVLIYFSIFTSILSRNVYSHGMLKLQDSKG